VDDYSRFTWVYFLRDKLNVFETFKSFAILSQNQFEFDIKKVRSDNGSEFKNARIDEYFDDKGIKMNFLPNIHRNKMEMLKGKIELSLIWLGLW
jgi:hypothetical protein